MGHELLQADGRTDSSFPQFLNAPKMKIHLGKWRLKGETFIIKYFIPQKSLSKFLANSPLISWLWNSETGVLWKGIRDSSVGTATYYGQGIETLWGGGWDLLYPSRPALGPRQPLFNGYRVFPGGEAAVAWRWPLRHLASRLKGDFTLSLP